MINKKNLLGKVPDELGTKDAIHTAIVSVRAGGPIKPGERVGLNKNREAVRDDKGCGVADPFRKGVIATGQFFWLVLAQDEIPNVQHHWEHPKLDFSPPDALVSVNKYLAGIADNLGVTYEQLMSACDYVIENEKPAPYPGIKTEEELEEAWKGAHYYLWSEWSGESGHEFENYGSGCCPEYAYPDGPLFKFGGKK